MDSITSQQTPRANDHGIAFTSSSPFTGYHYSSQPALPTSSPYWNSPSSILAHATSREASSPMSRTVSSESNTVVSSGEDSESDIEVSTMTSHLRCHARNPPTQQPSQIPTSLSPFTAPPITLLVGGPQSPSKETAPVPFYVHEPLLTTISPFFRAAFEVNASHGFGESVSREMRLPEERPEDFAYMLQWVYWRLSNQHDRDFGAAGGGLWHAGIDEPLEAYRLYREKRKIVRQADSVQKEKEGRQRYTGATSTIGAIVSGMPVPQAQPLPPSQPTQTQAAIDTVTSNDATPQNPEQASTQPSKSKLTRPQPPAFGPLVRLYILADKYSLPTQLKQDICTRVRDAGREARCVPDADDVALLWDSTLEHVSTAHSDEEEPNLKAVVLTLYENLGVRSFQGLFFGVASTSDSALPMENGEAMGAGIAAQGVADEVGDGYEDAWKWHPNFMRDLMHRMFAKVNEASITAANGKGDKAGEVAMERVVGDGLGRIRRTERFPSLYGAASGTAAGSVS